MPRAGLDPQVVVAAAARLADEVGLAHVTMSVLAERLGVRAPSLYKHVDGQGDLNRRVAVLALTELGGALRDALQGRAGKDALDAAARAIRSYAVAHPGRYSATVRIDADELDEQLVAAGARVLDSLSAVLVGYPVAPEDTVHALRMLRSLFHGFAVLEAAGGFQLATDLDESFTWLVDAADRALRTTLRDGDGLTPTATTV
ncbi:TetR-like C-terminal domain-containing protein [Cellulomonas gelida]|uniref:TetR family transcriptional regulator n=1 Tax=Cellulomonas gelida TaxID=1712 RepID=A0A4Y3KKS5_9CELL|nr:TetR-like C-terminal domain-containing protein [Cellulomonas gelida]GEA84493.1 TetR family transcriptional regulator [Cellulomonas gelida]GGL38235.1 TetR family transcriptional regulator [Cellulomonas gelida]